MSTSNLIQSLRASLEQASMSVQATQPVEIEASINPPTPAFLPRSSPEPATGTIFAAIRLEDGVVPVSQVPQVPHAPQAPTCKRVEVFKRCLRYKVKTFARRLFRRKAFPRVEPLPDAIDQKVSNASSPDKLILSLSNCPSRAASLSSHPGPNCSTSRYQSIKKLGEGGNGVVELARDRRVGSLVAIKTLRFPKGRDYVPDEVNILDEIGRHPNIVQYHTAFMESENADGTGRLFTRIVMEYYPLGDLHDYILEHYRKEPAPEMFLWHMMKEISAGLAHMHLRSIVHGDLKPSNVLCGAPQPNSLWPDLKIADFGTSLIDPPVNVPLAHHGTYGYMPPESSKFFGLETDVWSLGVIVHWSAVGSTPWKDVEVQGLSDKDWLACILADIPSYIPHPKAYGEMLLWFRHHELDIVDLHNDRKEPHSKLLDYFMSRTLSSERTTRITASALYTVLPTLEEFALAALQGGNADLLDCFENVDKNGWTVSVGVVLQQLIKSTKRRAKGQRNRELKGLTESLRRAMTSL